MKLARALPITAVLCLAFAPPALGHGVITAGTGFGHDLAVDSRSLGHVVFLSDGPPRVNYCRIPAAGGGCDGESTTLDLPGAATGTSAQVFTSSPAKVIVLASCASCGAAGAPSTFRWISNNNGVTFGAPLEVGNLPLSGQASYLNSGTLFFGVGGPLFQAMDAPPPETSQLDLGGGMPFLFSAAVVPDEGGGAVYAVNDLTTVKYAVFNDPPPNPTTAAELNTPASWQTGKLLPGAEPDNDGTHLSTGPKGVFLTYRYFAGGDNRVALRKFDSASETFGAPVYVEGPDPIENNNLDYPHHSQDPAGRLHVVWATPYDGGRIRYTLSEDGGASFATVGTIARGDSFIEPIVEMSSSNKGFAVWQGAGGAIRVIGVHSQPDALPDPDPPTISDFRIADRTLTSGQGTTFRFNSSEGGAAVLTFEKQVKGLKLKQKGKRRCLPQTKRRLRKLRRSLAKRFSGKKLARKLRKRRCKAFKKVGEIRQAVTAGPNEIQFDGRIAGRKLSRGSYRAKLVVTDDAGNASKPKTISFRVIGK